MRNETATPATCYCSITWSCKEMRTLACMLLIERVAKFGSLDEWSESRMRQRLLCMLMFAHRNLAMIKHSNRPIQCGYETYMNAEDRFIRQLMGNTRMTYASPIDGD